jgi:hypothetical protein
LQTLAIAKAQPLACQRNIHKIQRQNGSFLARPAIRHAAGSLALESHAADANMDAGAPHSGHAGRQCAATTSLTARSGSRGWRRASVADLIGIPRGLLTTFAWFAPVLRRLHRHIFRVSTIATVI